MASIFFSITQEPWAIARSGRPLRASGPLIYLEGQGDLVSGLTMGIIRVTIWVIGVINPLTKSR